MKQFGGTYFFNFLTRLKILFFLSVSLSFFLSVGTALPQIWVTVLLNYYLLLLAHT